MLELLLKSLCSKTLSAPSFGRYWKQLIDKIYSIIAFVLDELEISNTPPKILGKITYDWSATLQASNKFA